MKYLPKVFGNIMYKQIVTFMDTYNFFPKFQCGFKKGYSTKQYLIALIEKWKGRVDVENLLVLC